MEPAGLNYIVTPDECCIESNSKEVRARKGIVILEPNHDVAVQLESPRQFQVDDPLLLEVELNLIRVILIRKYLCLVQAIDLVHLIKWFITTITETTC